MPVAAIGLNHRTMALELFERFTVRGPNLTKCLGELRSRDHISEAVVLSTCGRTEVYLVTEQTDAAASDVASVLSDISFVPRSSFSEHLWERSGPDATRHLLSVAAGLESDVIGEAEILGQVRAAHRSASEEGAVGPLLDLLLRRAIETGRRVRTETAISRGAASTAQTALAMAEGALGDLRDVRVLILGAGTMAEGMAALLSRAGTGQILVANRTPAAADALAGRIGGRAIRLTDVPDALGRTDLLLASTGSPIPTIERGDVESATRDGHRIVVVDLGVPRDVDPGVAEVGGATLFDMDDLSAFAAAGNDRRRDAIAAAAVIVDDEARRFLDAAAAREVDPLVSALHRRGEEIRRAELARFTARSTNLGTAEREAVEDLTRRLVNKLLHDPTIVVKDGAGGPDGDDLAAALRRLHRLEDRPDLGRP